MPTEHKDTLATVHDAMNLAATSCVDEPTQPMTIKVRPSTRHVASEICKRNGTTLSGWLRACCELLVEDYHPRRQ